MTVAFDGYIAGPVLLAMAVVVAIAGRRDDIARWAAIGFGVVGGGIYLSYAPPSSLVRGHRDWTQPPAVSTLVASLLLVACAITIAWSWKAARRYIWAGSAAVIGYAVTAFTVTAGVLVGGEGGGFFAGHMAATICWIAMAAALFIYAARLSQDGAVAADRRRVWRWWPRRWPSCSCSTSARWTASSASWCSSSSGWSLLGMGAGYARLLERQDQQQDQAGVTGATQ